MNRVKLLRNVAFALAALWLAIPSTNLLAAGPKATLPQPPDHAAPTAAIGRALIAVGKTDGRGRSGAEARRALIHSKVNYLKELNKQLHSN